MPTKEATPRLINAVAWNTQTNGEPDVETADVRVFDDGLHITGCARSLSDPTAAYIPYLGAAVPLASGWGYLFGELPGK